MFMFTETYINFLHYIKKCNMYCLTILFFTKENLQLLKNRGFFIIL